MSARLDTFLIEVRTAPGFVDAAASDSKWFAELEKIERALKAVDRLADNDPTVIDILDSIQDVVGRTDLSVKARLIEVGKLLVLARATLMTAH